MKRTRIRAVLRYLAIIIFYVGSGKLGLFLAATAGGYAAPVWAPTGIAIAGLVLWGKRYAPAVWISAFIVNFFIRKDFTPTNFVLASAIATGNMLEALVAEHVLRRVYRFTPTFERMTNAAGFITVSLLAPVISATIGIGAIHFALGAALDLDPLGSWLTWWVGDALGAFVFGPLFIAFATKQRSHERRLGLPPTVTYPALMAFACFLLLSWVVPSQMRQFLIPFTVSTVLIWCALTMSDRWFFLTIATLSAVRIAFAYVGFGPFSIMLEMVQRMIVLQSFLGCTLPTLLILRAVIAERLAAVEVAQAREAAMLASEKMSALGQVASGIAHEISNPLSVIYGKTAFARELLDSGKLEVGPLREAVDRIDAMAARIEKIVTAVRFFSRTSEKDPFQLTSVKAIVEDTASLSMQQFRKKNAELFLEPVPDGVEIECKPVQVAQVLLNLLNNALTAVAGGSERWVRLSVVARAGYVEFVVVDSGPGVPLSIRTKIFQPFFTTKKVGEGTGLGLSVSRTIVEAHQGTLELDPSSDRTRFVARFPLRRSAEVASSN